MAHCPTIQISSSQNLTSIPLFKHLESIRATEAIANLYPNNSIYKSWIRNLPDNTIDCQRWTRSCKGKRRSALNYEITKCNWRKVRQSKMQSRLRPLYWAIIIVFFSQEKFWRQSVKNWYLISNQLPYFWPKNNNKSRKNSFMLRRIRPK